MYSNFLDAVIPHSRQERVMVLEVKSLRLPKLQEPSMTGLSAMTAGVLTEHSQTTRPTTLPVLLKELVRHSTTSSVIGSYLPYDLVQPYQQQRIYNCRSAVKSFWSKTCSASETC